MDVGPVWVEIISFGPSGVFSVDKFRLDLLGISAALGAVQEFSRG